MKYAWTIIMFVLFTGSLLAQPNSGFEKWSSNFAFEDPNVWKTSNRDSDNELQVIYKSNDAKDGKYSIRLESDVYEDDSILGYTIIGDIGDNGPEGGIPVSSDVDSLIFWVKYKVMPGDSAIAFLATRHNGSATGMNLIGWVGESNTWERKSVKVTPALMDSVVIGFASSDGLKDIAFPGSWLQIDNISLKDKTGKNIPFPNQSFEDWDSMYYTNPDDWFTENKKLGDQANVTRSINKHTGSFAARLETTYFDNDTMRGYLTNAPHQKDGFGKMPLIYFPEATFDSIEVYYQYFPVNQDGAEIRVELHAKGNRIAEANYYVWDSTKAYQRLIVPFTYFSQEGPDSIRIVFSSGKQIGSVLYIDDFSLLGKGVSIREINSLPISLYPNPAKDYILIETPEINLNNAFEIYDISGKVIKEGKINQSKQLDLSNFTKGVYFLKVYNKDNIYSQKFVKD